jgi:hypothetical protein
MTTEEIIAKAAYAYHIKEAGWKTAPTWKQADKQAREYHMELAHTILKALIKEDREP